MKYIMLLVGFIVVNTFWYSFLQAAHNYRYDNVYEQCKQELIKNNNYKTQQQAFDCVKEDPYMKILGTALFREGSIFE